MDILSFARWCTHLVTWYCPQKGDGCVISVISIAQWRLSAYYTGGQWGGAVSRFVVVYSANPLNACHSFLPQTARTKWGEQHAPVIILLTANSSNVSCRLTTVSPQLTLLKQATRSIYNNCACFLHFVLVTYIQQQTQHLPQNPLYWQYWT